MKQAIKALLLPDTPRAMKILWGIGCGLTIPINPQSELRIWLGLYELELTRHLRRLVAPGMRCYDVGGQYGFDALVLARLSGGHVVSFEADETLVPRMRRAFDLNAQLVPALEEVHAFVGRGDAISLSLDEFAGERHPDFIKIDVDGAELEVLMGAERILRETHPALIVETHSLVLERQCGEFLVARGYKPMIVNQRALLPDWRPIPHNRWLVAT